MSNGQLETVDFLLSRAARLDKAGAERRRVPKNHENHRKTPEKAEKHAENHEKILKNPPKRHRPRPKRQPPGDGRPSGAFREVVEVQHAAAVAGVDLRGQRPLEGHLASPEVAVLGRFLEKIDEKTMKHDENP